MPTAATGHKPNRGSSRPLEISDKKSYSFFTALRNA